MLENEVNDNRKPNITWKMKKKGRLCVLDTVWNVLERGRHHARWRRRTCEGGEGAREILAFVGFRG